MRRFLQVSVQRRWLPAVLWAILIVIVSSLPDPDVPERLRGCDKIVHFVEYFILGWAMRYWARGPKAGFLAGGIGFAALDEFHQAYIPGRAASHWDFVADAAGITLGFLLMGRFTFGKMDNE